MIGIDSHLLTELLLTAKGNEGGIGEFFSVVNIPLRYGTGLNRPLAVQSLELGCYVDS